MFPWAELIFLCSRPFPLEGDALSNPNRKGPYTRANNCSSFKHGMVEGVIGNIKRYITPKKTFGHKLVGLLRLFCFNQWPNRRLPPRSWPHHKVRWVWWGGCRSWGPCGWGVGLWYCWSPLRGTCSTVSICSGMYKFFFVSLDRIPLIAISMSDWFAICTISGVLFGQGSTSNPGILARSYFKRLIPAKIFLPQRLHVNTCLLGSCTGSPYTHIGSNAFGIFFRWKY